MGTITAALHDRMKYFKVRATPNGTNAAATANDIYRPETIAEHNDPFQLDWIDDSSKEEVLIGDQV